MGILSPFSSREKKAKEVKRSKCKGDGPFNPTNRPSIRVEKEGKGQAGGGGRRGAALLSAFNLG